MNLHRWDDIAFKELIPGIVGRLIDSDRTMFCRFHYEPGVNEPIHRHESKQFSYVIKGGVCFLSEEAEIEEENGNVEAETNVNEAEDEEETEYVLMKSQYYKYDFK